MRSVKAGHVAVAAAIAACALPVLFARAQPGPPVGPQPAVITVDGPIAPDSLGFTLMHEHLLIDFLLPDLPTGYRGRGPLPADFARRFQETGRYFRVPRTTEQQAFWDAPDLTPAMNEGFKKGWLSRVDLRLDSATALTELAAFRARGGGTVVDVTTAGIGRAPDQVRRLARATGVRVVMGTGWYRWPFQPRAVLAMSVEQLTDRMVRDLTVGFAGTTVRAGIIGEIPVDAAGLALDGAPGILYPDSTIMAAVGAAAARIRSGRARLEDVYHPFELRLLRAAARASRRTGAAITLHAPDPWLAYLDLLGSEGADLHRVVIGHADAVVMDDSLTRAALARGVFLQLDHTLQTYATGEVGPIDRLLDRVAELIREGHASQLLLSLDLCFRRGLARYGGGGLVSLADRILPGLRARGVSEAAIREITVTNPARVLAIPR